MNDVPIAWAVARLGDLGEWVGGGTPSKAVADYWRGEIPWVSAKDMKVERITDAIDHISQRAVDESSTRIVPGGSVLVVTRSGILGHTLPVAVTDREVAINQDLKALAPGAGVDPGYVAWALRTSAQWILASCSKSGTTVANVNTKMLLDFEIPFAPLAEQRRIVAAIEEQFSRLDAALASTSVARARLRMLRSSILARLDALPLGHTVGDVAEVRGGIQKQPKRRPAANAYPFLRVANVLRGRLDLGEVHQIELFDGELGRYRLQRGDLLVVEGNGSREQIGRSALWVGEIKDCVHQNHLIRVRPGPLLDADFLALYWNAPGCAERLAQVASTSSGLYTLSVSKLQQLRIAVPSLEEQREIVAEIEQQLSLIDSLRAAVESAQKRSAALRRAILERAFRGELVPQDQADEPASALLERIAAERAATPKPRRRKRVTA